jgi:hypothetical protein
MGAPLGTVINTFGGPLVRRGWNAQLTFPQTTEAIKFYVDTVKAVGEPGATQSGFTECETLMAQGKVAMWYDASSAADFLFDPKQNTKADQMGIAYAPTKVKSPSGWLWAWAFAIESTSKNKAAALEFVKWATSKDYYNLVNQKTSGWGGVPSGARKSLYEVAGYKDYAKAFGPIVVDSLNTVDPLHATNFPDTPYTGIQYVQIQEFQDLGTKCTQEYAAAISGSESTDDAINKCQGWQTTSRRAAATSRALETRPRRATGSSSPVARRRPDRRGGCPARCARHDRTAPNPGRVEMTQAQAALQAERPRPSAACGAGSRRTGWWRPPSSTRSSSPRRRSS